MNMNEIPRKSAADIERELFSARLRHALQSNGYSGDSATKLQREFNARSDKPVTVHCARKWLMCESIPTQERIKVLADWLGVSAQYLRFGGADSIVQLGAQKLPPESVKLLADLSQLHERDQVMFRKLVALMVREPRV